MNFAMLLGLVISVNQSVELDPRLSKVPEDLLSLPRVVYVNDFDDESARRFEEDMEEAKRTGQPVIPVVIDSYGGSVYSLLSMVDTIKNIGVPVATVAKGKAMSAGALLLSCGTEGMRYATPNSTILIHDVSSMASGKVGDIVVEAAEAERLNKLLFTMLAKNVGKPDNYFTDLIFGKGRVDIYLTPDDALKHNIINKIGDPQLKTKVTLTTTLE